MPSGEFSGMDPWPISMQGTEKKGQRSLWLWEGDQTTGNLLQLQDEIAALQ